MSPRLNRIAFALALSIPAFVIASPHARAAGPSIVAYLSAYFSGGVAGQVWTQQSSGAPAWGTVSAGVASTRALNTASPLSGGGDLSADRTLTLGTVPETKGGTNQTTYTTGDLLYASGANTLAKLGIGSSTNVLTVTGGVPTWAAASGGSGVTGTATYGDGSDGAVTFDGSTTIKGIVPSGNLYLMQVPCYFTNATVNAGITVVGACPIRCTGTLTVASTGIIHNNGYAGGNAVGTTGGSAGVGAYGYAFGVSLNGGAGGTGVNGNGGSSSAMTALTRQGGLGGIGGASVGTAGAAGTGSLPGFTQGTAHSTNALFGWLDGAASTNTQVPRFNGGTGGGGGGAGAAAGGGGGGNGGVMVIAAKAIANSGTISANGGNGGNGASTTGAGGGGGGGGVVILCYNSFTGSAATATGGTKGTGTVGSPADGGSGLVVTLSNNQ